MTDQNQNGADQSGQQPQSVDVQMVLQQIAALAMRIDDLMGAIDPRLDQLMVNIHVQPSIVVPGKPAQIHQILISKPLMMGTIDARKNLRGPSVVGG